MRNVNVSVEIRYDNIIQGLIEQNQDDVFDFIKEIDLKIADLDFTLQLIAQLINGVQTDATFDEVMNYINEHCKK